jgi:hypothetical protein
MSKASKILMFLSTFVFITIISSCVNDDEYSIPDVIVPAVDLAALGTPTTFAAVLARYQQALADGDQIATFEFDDPLFITGYVVSSDQAGNFFEELLIQNRMDGSDDMADPRLGLKVEINVQSLSDTYEFGRKIYIKLNGLAVGESNGVITIGKASGSSVEQIQGYEYRDFVVRDPEVATILPKMVSISDLTEADENTFVQLDNVQIHRNELVYTFAGEPFDEFDGFRTLESCSDSGSMLLQTSTFADFKSIPLPQNSGSIKGIFTRDFGDDFNVFVINSLGDIDMTGERCDPIELDCGLASSVGGTNLFADDFEGQSTGALITGNGWTNYIEAGTEGWEAYTSGGANASQGISARVGSFSSGDASSVAWLITPQIDLNANTGVTLSFETSNSFSDGSSMELLFSNDWDGTEANITSATWGVLPAAYIVQDSDFFGDWLDSGDVDLSCGSGTMHFAFKYTGSGQADFDGTYELDFVSVDAQ